MKVLAGFVIALLVLALTCIVYIYSGYHNVAAVEAHTPLASWALNTAMRRSVRIRAQTITPPPEPTPQKVREAFRSFNEMCVQCHGAPGKEPGEIGKGLQPPAPTLGEVVARWNRAELFWIVKNGIRMTGMPAFGPTHSDDQLWVLVAFLQRLPSIAPAEYKKMEREAGKARSGHRH